jgi:hypothetical protein
LQQLAYFFKCNTVSATARRYLSRWIDTLYIVSKEFIRDLEPLFLLSEIVKAIGYFLCGHGFLTPFTYSYYNFYEPEDNKDNGWKSANMVKIIAVLEREFKFNSLKSSEL